MHSLGVALAFPGSAVLVEIEGGEGDGEIERERTREQQRRFGSSQGPYQ